MLLLLLLVDTSLRGFFTPLTDARRSSVAGGVPALSTTCLQMDGAELQPSCGFLLLSVAAWLFLHEKMRLLSANL